MHPNPIYRSSHSPEDISFLQDRGFGVLAVNGDAGPLLSHIPFQLSPDTIYIEAHLVRSNPIWRALSEGPLSAVMAVSGGDSYVSPDWYDMPDQVPTWNYVAVHLRGTLRQLPQEELLGILERLSGEFERRLMPKPPWLITKMTPDALERMLCQIVPIALDIHSIEGTWKMSQNKPAPVRAGVVQGLATSPIGQNVSQISDLMSAALKEVTP